jgi:tetraacyldisaccharide 4'-kinase
VPLSPAFWGRDGGGLLPWLLSPLAALTTAYTARRVDDRAGWRAPVPVICCGNVTVGGAGKTTLALDLGRRLVARGRAVHFLLRGYGGTRRGPHLVAPGESVDGVGDEALLLAAVAPTWTSGDRAASARSAVAAGAEVLVLDDGLQNPTLRKDLSLLVVNGATGFGNGHVLPSGPLREPIAAGAARCQAAVLIGHDTAGVAAMLPPELPVLRARLVSGPEVAELAGRKVLAFAGIASPDRFFTTLRDVGVDLAGTQPFADHHRFTDRELRRLLEQAAQLDAALVTTPKDAVRLPDAIRREVRVLGVTLEWEDNTSVEALLTRALCRRTREGERNA